MTSSMENRVGKQGVSEGRGVSEEHGASEGHGASVHVGRACRQGAAPPPGSKSVTPLVVISLLGEDLSMVSTHPKAITRRW